VFPFSNLYSAVGALVYKKFNPINNSVRCSERFPNVMECVKSNYEYYKTVKSYWVLYKKIGANLKN